MSMYHSCIVVRLTGNGEANLSQYHYRLHKDDIGEEYRSDEQRREMTIQVRPDETRKSLFNRLNKAETFIISMNGKLEKTRPNVAVCENDLYLLD